MYSSTSPVNSALERGVINVVPANLLPERNGVSIVQEAGSAPGPVWKTSGSPKFDNRTVQLLAIHYTDYAINPLLQLGRTV
jgi:hypothetical protein